MTGWISLHRQIKDHWIWDDAQKLKWWLDILLRANHKDNKVVIGNKIMVVKRGEFHTSESKLAEQWNCSRNTVRSFIKLLESDEMITTNKTKNGTTIKVRHYNDYQTFSNEKKQPSEQQTEQNVEQNTEQMKDHQLNRSLHTNNNVNNANNELTMNNNDNNRQDNVREIISYYESNGYGTIGQSVVEQFDDWLNYGFEHSAIIEALKIGVENSNRTLRYVRGIINNWKKDNTKMLNDIRANEKERSYNQSSKKKGSDYYDSLPQEQKDQYENLPF